MHRNDESYLSMVVPVPSVHDTTVRLDFSIRGKMYSKSGTNAEDRKSVV